MPEVHNIEAQEQKDIIATIVDIGDSGIL